MELKKNPKIDLRKKYYLFLNAGLVVSLICVISAFQYKSRGTEGTIDLNQPAEHFDSIMNIPNTVQEPPPPPKQMAPPKIIAAPNDLKLDNNLKVNLDINANEDTRVAPVTIQQTAPPDEKADQIFTIVEDEPSPKGGMAGFYSYVSKNLKYPSQARRLDIEGKVFVQFVVDKDGSLTDVKVLKGIGSGCDQEAVRVIQEAPKWNPGKQRGRPVRVRMVMPIVFTLSN